MNDHIDFEVTCKMDPTRKVVIRVYYVHHDGKPFPLPPNYCDNAYRSEICDKCNSEVLEKALTTQPPFFQ